MAEAVEIIEDDPIEVRRAKREALIAAGIDPYGHSVKRSHTVGELNEKYAHLEDGESTEDEVLIAGRVMAKRVQGKIAFLELRESGCDIQLFCRINALGEEAFAALCDLDVGDWIAVHGTMMRTKRGQLSVAVDSLSAIKYAKVKPIRDENGVAVDFETVGDFPKYGNDDDFADAIAADLWKWFSTCTMRLKMYRGHYCDAAVQMVQSNVGYGAMTGATPNGRLAGMPLSDTMSATQQADTHGPTAAARSYGKLDFPAYTNGTLLNMWISQSELIEQS